MSATEVEEIEVEMDTALADRVRESAKRKGLSMEEEIREILETAFTESTALPGN